jgi:hypothetical protein
MNMLIAMNSNMPGIRRLSQYLRDRAGSTFILPRMEVAIRLVVLLILACSPTIAQAEWIKAHDGKHYGISGIALLAQRENQTDFLVVHDNKKKDDPRLGVVMAKADKVDYRALRWPNEDNLPVDLESISTVPDHPEQFVAVASDGALFALSVSEANIRLLSHFVLPGLPPNTNIEGFTVQKLGDELVAAWAHRGAGPQKGILYWGLLDLKQSQVSVVSKAEVGVPFPLPVDPNTRHITDLKLDPNGVLWATAANDPGDSGPFVSAVYTLGVLHATKMNGVVFEPNTNLTRLWTFSKKVEAIELVPGARGGIAFGTDDEDDGGWLFFK